MQKHKKFTVEVSPEEEYYFLEWVSFGGLDKVVKDVYTRRLERTLSEFNDKSKRVEYCTERLLQLASSQMRSSSSGENLLRRLEMEVLAKFLEYNE